MKAIEDGLRRLDGVSEIRTDLQRNLVEMTPRPDAAVDLASIPQRIQQSGFRAGTMWIVARGEAIRMRDEIPAFRIHNWPEALPLDGVLPDHENRPLEFEVVVEGESLKLRPGRMPSGGR